MALQAPGGDHQDQQNTSYDAVMHLASLSARKILARLAVAKGVTAATKPKVEADSFIIQPTSKRSSTAG